MKFVHHRYKSHPPLGSKQAEGSLKKDLEKIQSAIRVGVLRLKVWEHIEIQDIRLDGVDPLEVVTAYIEIRAAHFKQVKTVVRRYNNGVRIWRVPANGDWKARTRLSQEWGAIEGHGILEFKQARRIKHAEPELPEILKDLSEQKK